MIVSGGFKVHLWNKTDKNVYKESQDFLENVCNNVKGIFLTEMTR